MQFSTKRWFTIVEILIVSIILAVWFVAIIWSMNRWLNFTQKTREKVIAINLVRESMEVTYQMRDTNLRRWSGKRDQCWLKIDPLDSSEWNPDTCIDDSWMKKSFYSIDTKINNGQEHYYLTDWWPTAELNLDDDVDATDLRYSLCNTWWVWEACPNMTPESPEWKYFRQLEWKWLYRKDRNQLGWEEIFCDGWDDIDNLGEDCGDDKAKEYRFCNKVAYIWFGQWEVELCWLITNFYD